MPSLTVVANDAPDIVDDEYVMFTVLLNKKFNPCTVTGSPPAVA